jgi:hypothetical protein
MANSPSYVSQASVPGILKELYDDQKVQWLTYKDNPFHAMVKKETRFPGKYFPNPVVYGLSQGASATFASAYNNQTSPLVAEFLVTRVSDFSLATIDGQLLASAQTDPGAFIDGSELMIDAAFQTAVNRICAAEFRNGAGTIGQMSAFSNATTTWTITLNNPDDAVQFEIGQTLVAVQNVDGSGTLSTDYVDLTSVNRNTGALVGTGSTGSPSSAWTAGTYYLAVQGDTPTTSNNNFQPAGSTTTNSLLKTAGLAAWLPLTAPSGSDSFFGVNRSVDVQRLAGVTGNFSSLSLEEALLQGTGRVALNGGRVDTGACSYSTYTALITSLGSKVQYIDEKIGEIGFRGVQVNGANTVMSVFPDRSCPDGVIYLLEMDSIILRSQGEAPQILKYMDEIEILRIPGVDAAELRVGGYFNMYITKPGHNGAIQVQLQEF